MAISKDEDWQILIAANPHPLILTLLQPKIISTICGIIARAKFIKPSEPSDFLPLLLQEDILRRDTNR